MDPLKIILLLINVIGGAAVIGSYMLGLRGKTGGSEALWGGVPARVRPVYTISMLLSAIGYLAVLYYLFFELVPDKVVIAGSGFALFFPIFLLILIPSALWMPLTNAYVSAPRTRVWLAVRTVLFIVGFASVALAWALVVLKVDKHSTAHWLAVAGSCYFAFHTLFLDAILWAALSKHRR